MEVARAFRASARLPARSLRQPYAIPNRIIAMIVIYSMYRFSFPYARAYRTLVFDLSSRHIHMVMILIDQFGYRNDLISLVFKSGNQLL